ncbi:MAG: cyanoglobin [Deltaproteobacteria bacterium]|nr:cyanoglobin [Myxococcales bacterium]MDP3219564.1 cyanoglobin [Deltaproteobacteria bacterium]
MTFDPTKVTPYEALGGEAKVREVAARFYDAMDAHEPALAALHRLDDAGRVHPEAREKFALFFIGWLGGPQTYMERHGHPRLRMRHAGVEVTAAMRDAWMRAMKRALDESGVTGDVRDFVEAKLGDVATMLRNAP